MAQIPVEQVLPTQAQQEEHRRSEALLPLEVVAAEDCLAEVTVLVWQELLEAGAEHEILPLAVLASQAVAMEEALEREPLLALVPGEAAAVLEDQTARAPGPLTMVVLEQMGQHHLDSPHSVIQDRSAVAVAEVASLQEGQGEQEAADTVVEPPQIPGRLRRWQTPEAVAAEEETPALPATSVVQGQTGS